jgi:hypothetical protein
MSDERLEFFSSNIVALSQSGNRSAVQSKVAGSRDVKAFLEDNRFVIRACSNTAHSVYGPNCLFLFPVLRR